MHNRNRVWKKILASIRRIISEDEDDTATTEAEAAPSDAAEPEVEAAMDESEDTELALENETPQHQKAPQSKRLLKRKILK